MSRRSLVFCQKSHIALRPLANWLPSFKRRNPGRYKQVVGLIDRLLPEGAGFSGKLQGGEYLFAMGKTMVPFGALSDGYRAYIGWITDLLYHVCMGAPSGAKLVDNRGLVLVDEIDLHLHPEWQRTVISRISDVLPNIQFVFTTHSPIVAGSLHSENVFVMEQDSTGVSVVRQLEERLYGKDAEQVLLSSYFNLNTTRAPGFVDELEALSRKATRTKPDVALQIMQKLSGEPDIKATSNGSEPKGKPLRRSRASSGSRSPATSGKRAKSRSGLS